MLNIPTRTTIYIDAAGIEETPHHHETELVAIQTALATFVSHEWIGKFTDSLSSLQAILHHNTNPGSRSSLNYHHYMLLLESITDLLETKRLADFQITLHK